ncbi:hypothetical protein [Brucella gallinifaecis]|uniref:hypothetical protein n=1 Tax=Brucella gallinifaecis TaxID=215590 RepID=UPI00236217E0|nr:hypothetical protein [Brucella gallinifaecis]
MADLRLRINELPEELAPEAIDNIAIDGPSTRRTTAAALANATRPYSTEPQAREGLSDVSVMSPLRVNQAIETLGGQRFATSSQGNKADSAVQPTLTLTAGAGLTGGGTLAANRTFALSTTSLASLALADSAVQTVNGKSGTVITLTPGDVGAVPVARETEIVANTAARHLHTNKAILDAVTAAFTTVLKAKLDGIPSDADKTPALADVATSGNYDDLDNKPSIPAAQVQTDWNASTGIASIANKPATFPPSAHTHSDATTTVAGFMSAADKVKLNGMAAGATANTGTVTSVAVSVPTGLSVANSPVTTSGAIAITYATGYQGFTTAEATKLSGIPADADKTPALAPVATSGAYNDLTGKPTLGALAAKSSVAIADIAATGTPSSGTFLRGDGTWGTVAGAGTVTSVGLSAPTGFSVSNSPVTGSGALTFSYATGYQGFTTAEATKLSGIAAGAQVNTVTSVAGRTGAVTLTSSDVSLGNVANKSEAQMVASGAISDALGGKINKAGDAGLGGFSSSLVTLPYSNGRTITPNLSDGNYQQFGNDGPFTLNAPASAVLNTTILINIWPEAGAGPMTAVGFHTPPEGTFNPAKQQLLQVVCISNRKKLIITDG